jgi:hypothetical protein
VEAYGAMDPNKSNGSLLGEAPKEQNGREGKILRLSTGVVAYFVAVLLLIGISISGCDGPDLVGKANKNAAEMRRLADASLVGVVALGTSNYPFLKDGEKMVLVRVPFEAVIEGQIVAFYPYFKVPAVSVPPSMKVSGPPGMVSHFAVKISGGRIITKGLNNPVEDPSYVTKDNYVGILVKLPE